MGICQVNLSQFGPGQQTTENDLNYSGCPQQRKYYADFIAQSIPRNASGNNFQRHGISTYVLVGQRS